ALREAAAREPRLELEERAYRPGDERGATLVVAATDDRAVNALVTSRAREAGIPINVADAPAEGTFTMAAVHRAGDLVVGVSAGGVPGAAARIRDAIAERFDHRYAAAVAALRDLRARTVAAGGGGRWRAAAGELLDERFTARVEDGTLTERVRQWA
ncbi:MAG TPA: NAD(P)-dependent oxidoreductase, partial [Gemmatimonadales bacterium]